MDATHAEGSRDWAHRSIAAGLFAVLCGLAGAPGVAQQAATRADPARLEQRLRELSRFGRNPEGGVSRVAFSEADVAARDYVAGLMREAGLTVRIDAAGNLIGRTEGRNPELPVIMFGSHIDSVPSGGNFDGDVGVIGAIECVQLLEEQSVTTRHPLEVIVFSDEEGGLTGSRALIGDLSDDALAVVSHSGMTIGDGIRAIGGDPDRLDEARYAPEAVAAFIELHIEQGSILDNTDVDIGVVEGIVGIEWWNAVIEGTANHAGTTPMDKRQDAMVAAAELTLAVNRIVTAGPGGQVGTVGRIVAEPGAPNVIPGRVVMSIEIRDLSAEKIWELFARIETEGRTIAQRRGTRVTFEHLDVAAAPSTH